MSTNYRFFQNRDCEYFPCHKGVEEKDFNCLFCFCPLYALGKKCGGCFRMLANGVKSCEDCVFPHLRDSYDAIIARFDDIAALACRDEGVL